MAAPILVFDSSNGSDRAASGAGINPRNGLVSGGLTLPGAPDNNASCPYSAAQNLAGDLDIIAKIRVTKWARGLYQVIACKWVLANSGAWEFRITPAGMLEGVVTGDGTSLKAGSSTAPGIADNTDVWVRMIVDVDNTGGGCTFGFYKSSDGVGWSFISAATVAGTLSIYPSSSPIEIGTLDNGGIFPFKGLIYKIEIRDGARLIASPDFAAQAAIDRNASSFTDAQGNIWSINKKSVGLYGTGASVSADGLTVTLSGYPELYQLPADGSCVLWLDDATAGARNFAQIVATNDTNQTVTVAAGQAFRPNATGLVWAIGGDRQSIGSTGSRKLFENNGGTGDAKPGWTLQMARGHQETLSSSITIRTYGDQKSDGYITLEGDRGAVIALPLPILTVSFNGTGIGMLTQTDRGLWRFRDFQMLCSAADRSNTIALNVTTAGNLIERLRIGSATGYFKVAVYTSGYSNCGLRMSDCYIEGNRSLLYGTAIQIAPTGISAAALYRCNYIRNIDVGIWATGEAAMPMVQNNIICGTRIAMYFGNNSAEYPALGSTGFITGNTIYDCTSSAICLITSSKTWSWAFVDTEVANNNIANSGGYGIYVGTPPEMDSGFFERLSCSIHHNNCFACSAGAIGANAALPPNWSNTSLDPQFADPANGDFSVGANLKALGWPDQPIGQSDTRSWIDLGAAQRKEAGVIVIDD